MFTWDKLYRPRPNPIADFDDSNTGPTNSLNAEATALDFFSLFIDDGLKFNAIRCCAHLVQFNCLFVLGIQFIVS